METSDADASSYHSNSQLRSGNSGEVILTMFEVDTVNILVELARVRYVLSSGLKFGDGGME